MTPTKNAGQVGALLIRIVYCARLSHAGEIWLLIFLVIYYVRLTCVDEIYLFISMSIVENSYQKETFKIIHIEFCDNVIFRLYSFMFSQLLK